MDGSMTFFVFILVILITLAIMPCLLEQLQSGKQLTPREGYTIVGEGTSGGGEICLDEEEQLMV